MITKNARPAGNTAYLDKSYSQATLGDHARWQADTARSERRFKTAVRSFFRLPEAEIAVHSTEHPLFDRPQITLALEGCFPDWTLSRLAGPVQIHCSMASWTPKWKRIETTPGNFRSFVGEGTWFFRPPDGRRLVFAVVAERTDVFEFLMLCAAADEPAALADRERLLKWFDEHHYLKGATIGGDGVRLPATHNVGWDDLFLADTARRAVLDNVRQFFACRDAFARNGVPNRRGLLLYGPPGNGKTLIGKVLRATEPATFMYLTANDAEYTPDMKASFALTRRLKPAIVFLEDLDLYATDRRGSADCRALGELLAQIDGLADNDGLMFIATTNDLQAIEPAIRERPNRFDVLIEIGSPDTAARKKILARRLAKAAGVGDNFLDEAARRTDGFSGAQVQEAAWRIIQQAIFNGSLTPDGIAQPTQRDLDAALPVTGVGPDRRRVGFVGVPSARGMGELEPVADCKSAWSRGRHELGLDEGYWVNLELSYHKEQSNAKR